MISIDDLDGELEIEVVQGPAREEGETDDEVRVRIEQYERKRQLEALNDPRYESAERGG
jgi:hypothetical protein